jgi:hypothetical protein
MFDWFPIADTSVATIGAPDAIDLLRSHHDSVKDQKRDASEGQGPGYRRRKAGSENASAKAATLGPGITGTLITPVP